jgi:hypothetical protein
LVYTTVLISGIKDDIDNKVFYLTSALNPIKIVVESQEQEINLNERTQNFITQSDNSVTEAV